GASSGIGLHLAREFASHGHPVVLVAQVESELREIATELNRQFGVRTRVIARNLEEPNSAQEIFDVLKEDGVEIDILVNNAGHGFKGHFWDISIQQDLSVLRLNVEAVLRLTKLFLPPMIGRGKGRILNTASVAGFEPGPLLAVYHASKAFVLSLSEALATELEEKRVTVTALCPGQTDTDFFPKAGMMETRAFQKGHVMAPQEVAQMGYEATMKGQRVIVTGAVNKAMVFSRHLMPESAQAKVNQKLYEDVAPEEHKRERGEVERKAEAERMAKV
ncbi:MAG TPA: SDR family oxidoreductase, partial [Prosthecobacter sp.]|nr:SDR family oxidoreductase [Prosthecobacter sp.]